jgi:hypothetical protein
MLQKFWFSSITFKTTGVKNSCCREQWILGTKGLGQLVLYVVCSHFSDRFVACSVTSLSLTNFSRFFLTNFEAFEVRRKKMQE